MSINKYRPHLFVLPEDEVADNTNELWGHDLLKHNKKELERMVLAVKPFLFKEVK